MKRFKEAILFIIVIFSLSTAANAAVPHLINYQGKVTDTSGNPLNGAYDITFRIYDAESAGNMLWQETQAGVIVDKGLFGILLGSVTALNIPFDVPYFLEIKVGAEVMSPRQRITSAGYALRAEVAESVEGIDPGMVGTKTVDETGLANGMRPYYNSASGTVRWSAVDITPIFSAGSVVFAFSDTETSVASNNYTKAKEILVGAGGTITTSFVLKNGAVGVKGRVYVNGVPVGTERTTSSSGTYTENITINAGDLVQVYIRINSGMGSAIVNNFRLSCGNFLGGYVRISTVGGTVVKETP